MAETFELDALDPLEAHVAQALAVYRNIAPLPVGILTVLTPAGRISDPMCDALYEVIRYHRITKAESEDRRRELDEIHRLSAPEDEVQ